jgi:hypothetical protein
VVARVGLNCARIPEERLVGHLHLHLQVNLHYDKQSPGQAVFEEFFGWCLKHRHFEVRGWRDPESNRQEEE